jgi:hypothetical protein
LKLARKVVVGSWQDHETIAETPARGNARQCPDRSLARA